MKASPPRGRSAEAEEVSLVRKTTTLGLHREPHFKIVGNTITFSHWEEANDEWGIAYHVAQRSSPRGKAPRAESIGALYKPCSVPQTDTSSPIARNIAALAASAWFAPAASGA